MYRGPDRRRVLVAHLDVALTPHLLAAAALVATMVLAALVTQLPPGPSAVAASLLTASAIAMALIISTASALWGWWTGDVRARWFASALLMLGVALATRQLGPDLLSPADVGGVWHAGLVAVALLAIGAALSPPVDTRRRVRVAVVAAIMALGAVAVALAAWPDPAQQASVVAGAAGHVVPAALLVAVALHGFGRTRQLGEVTGWGGWILLGLALAEVMQWLTAESTAIWTLPAAALTAVALAVGSVWVAWLLWTAYALEEGRVVGARAVHDDDVTRRRSADEDRAHEIRNALRAIDSASVTLHDYRADLTPHGWSQLAEALRLEIERLQQLVGRLSGTADEQDVWRERRLGGSPRWLERGVAVATAGGLLATLVVAAVAVLVGLGPRAPLAASTARHLDAVAALLGVVVVSLSLPRWRMVVAKGLPWAGLVLAGLAASEAVALLAPGPGGLMPALVRMTALLAGVCGALWLLWDGYAGQRRKVLEVHVAAAGSRRRWEHADRRRAEAAGDALAGLEGATRTLEHFRDGLTDGMRLALLNAVRTEVARLQRLTDDTAPAVPVSAPSGAPGR